MMIRCIIIACSLLTISAGVSAQNRLIIHTSNPECSDTVMLYNWHHGKQVQFTTLMTTGGSVTINIPQGTEHGMLQVNFRSSCFFFNYMLIYNGRDINMEVNTDNKGNTRFDIDGETPVFNSVNHRIDSLNGRIMKFIALESAFSDDTGFIKETNRFLDIAMNDRKKVFEELRSQYANYLFPHFLYYKEYHISGQTKSPVEQRKEMLDHFFDSFDPQDTLLLNSTVFEDRVLDWLNLTAGVTGELNEKDFIPVIDRFMKRLGNSEVMVKSSIDLMQKWLKEKGYDMTREWLDQQYLAVQCGSESDVDLQKRLAAYERTKTGKIAPDLVWMSPDTILHRLSDIRSTYTLLIFWASWCPHCKEILPDFHEKLKAKPDVQVIAIGLDPDEKAWEEAIARYPKWTHLRAPEKWNNSWVMDYGVYGTPSFFLLDRGKHIVAKSAQTGPVIESLEK